MLISNVKNVVCAYNHLNIGFGLVSDLHEELSLRIHHVLEDALVDAREPVRMRTS